MTSWREMVEQGKFDEAESIMLADTSEADGYGGETVTRAHFYEQWGDVLAPDGAAEIKYRESHDYWATFASWATSGGEGTARMLDVERVIKKIEALHSE